jgi:signal transduction histidine kinase
MWRPPKIRYFSSRLLRGYLIAATILIVCAMSLLAYAVSHTYRSSATLTAAEEGSLVIDLFLGRHVQELATSARLSPENSAMLDDLLNSGLGSRARSLKIWLRDGTLAYAIDKQLIGQRFPSPVLDAAFAGKTTGIFNDLTGADEQTERRMQRPLIEIHAPLHRPGTREIVAVAQVYNDGERLAAELKSVQIRSIAIVAAVTAPMMLFLFLMVRRAGLTVDAHQKRLAENVMAARAMAAQNERLRLHADEARMEAIHSNEQLLQNIGQDLHDGPIQLLSVLTIRLAEPNVGSTRAAPEVRQSTPNAEEILATALTDLRNIAQGLVLPQIDGLSTEETITLAIRQHENNTGTTVASDIAQLPDCSNALRICLFRIVQESLNNAFNHADGRGQRVAASTAGNSIQVEIRDSGVNAHLPRPAPRQLGLGLRGLRRRVELLRGTFEVSFRADGACVSARIPVKVHAD